MKTLLLELSPKPKRSTSKYLLSHLRVTLGKDVIRKKLKQSEYENIYNLMNECDNVVFATPIYVDGLPGSVVKFLEYLQTKEFKENIKLYAISNCGFYEGHQNKNSLKMIEAFCITKNISYMGGVGVGAGEMIGVTRYFNIALAFIIYLIEVIINLIVMLSNKDFNILKIFNVNLIGPSISIILYFVFNLRLYYNFIKLSRYIKTSKKFDNIYTSVFCPRFLFVIFADIFWIIKALFRKVLPHKLYKRLK